MRSPSDDVLRAWRRGSNVIELVIVTATVGLLVIIGWRLF